MSTAKPTLTINPGTTAVPAATLGQVSVATQAVPGPKGDTGNGAAADGATIAGAGTIGDPLRVASIDAAVGTASLRTLGTGAQQAAPGSKLPGAAPIDTTGATSGQVPVFNGASFVPGTPAAGILTGTLAARPAPSGVLGQLHYATDTALPTNARRSHADPVHGWVVDPMVFNFMTYVLAHGGDAVGGAACDAAWSAMMADLATVAAPAGPTVLIDAGTYRFAAAAHVTRACRIVGAGAAGLFPATVLLFALGGAGVVFDSVQTSPDGGRSDFAVMEGVAVTCPIPSGVVGPPAWQTTRATVLGAVTRPTVHNRYTYVCTTAGTTGSTEPAWPTDDLAPQTKTVTDGSVVWTCQFAHGIVARSRITVAHCLVSGFEGDGINVLGDTARTPSTNANGWELRNTRVQACQGNGVYVAGGDGNAGLGVLVDVDLSNPLTGLRSGMAGIYDYGFINNTWISCEVAFAGTHAYQCDNPANTATVFLGCYAEQGDGSAWPSTTGGNGPNHLASTACVVLGGFTFAAGYTVGTRALRLDSATWSALSVANALGSIGLADDGVNLIRMQAAGESFQTALVYENGAYVYKYAGLTGAVPFGITGSAHADGPAQMLAPRGFKIGTSGAARYVMPKGGYVRISINATSNAIGTGQVYDFAECLEIFGAPSADFSVTLPATSGDQVWLWNHTTTGHNMVVSVAGQSGATVAIAAGMGCLIASDGTNVRRLSAAIDPTS